MIIAGIIFAALLTYVAGFIITVPIAGRFYVRHSSYYSTRQDGIAEDEMWIVYMLGALWPFTMFAYIPEALWRWLAKFLGRFGASSERVRQYINRSAGV